MGTTRLARAPTAAPCSLCGTRGFTTACPRCKERNIAMSQGPIEQAAFEARESLRSAKKDIQILESDDMELGLPLTIALVGCGKQKRPTPQKARDLYCGSLFRLACEYAEQTADDVHIMSALHGLIPPYEEIAPYDFSINQMLIHERQAWGRKIVSDLSTFYHMRRLHVIFYAGQAYIKPIMDSASHQESYWTFENPLKGMDLFARLSWFRSKP